MLTFSQHVKIFYCNDSPACNPYEKCRELMAQIESTDTDNISDVIKSCLGSVPEGMVLKHDHCMKRNDYVATKIKYVSKKFKERHRCKQPKITYNLDDMVTNLGLVYNTEARFQKAYQHLREADLISEIPTITDLTKFEIELDVDFNKEYKDEIILELYLILGHEVVKFSRDDSFLWFMKKIGCDINDLGPSVLSEPSVSQRCCSIPFTKCTDKVYQIAKSIGLSYYSEKFLESVYTEVVNGLKSNPTKNDYGKFFSEYDKKFEAMHKANIQIILWDKVGQYVRNSARKDLVIWFNKSFILPCPQNTN